MSVQVAADIFFRPPMQILLFTSDFYFYCDYYYCQYWSDTMGWCEKKLQQWTVLWSGILCALHIWMKRRRYRYENNKYGEDNGFNAFSRKVWAQYDDDTPHNVSYSRVNKEKLLHSSLSLSSLLYPRLLYLYFFLDVTSNVPIQSDTRRALSFAHNSNCLNSLSLTLSLTLSQ